MSPINIFLADAAFLVREGLKAVIADYPYMKVVGEAGNSRNFRNLLPKSQADVVIIDYNAPGSYSIDDLEFIHHQHPYSKMLVITSNLQREEVLKVLELKTKGFLLKQCDQTEIIGAIHAAARDDKFFCGKVLDIILERDVAHNTEEECAPTRLSKRETEIVKLMAQGASTQEIADTLSLSVHTVYTHRKNIKQKLGASSAAEVVYYAVSTSLLE